MVQVSILYLKFILWTYQEILYNKFYEKKYK